MSTTDDEADMVNFRKEIEVIRRDLKYCFGSCKEILYHDYRVSPMVHDSIRSCLEDLRNSQIPKTEFEKLNCSKYIKIVLVGLHSRTDGYYKEQAGKILDKYQWPQSALIALFNQFWDTKGLQNIVVTKTSVEGMPLLDLMTPSKQKKNKRESNNYKGDSSSSNNNQSNASATSSPLKKKNKRNAEEEEKEEKEDGDVASTQNNNSTNVGGNSNSDGDDKDIDDDVLFKRTNGDADASFHNSSSSLVTTNNIEGESDNNQNSNNSTTAALSSSSNDSIYNIVNTLEEKTKIDAAMIVRGVLAMDSDLKNKEEQHKNEIEAKRGEFAKKIEMKEAAIKNLEKVIKLKDEHHTNEIKAKDTKIIELRDENHGKQEEIEEKKFEIDKLRTESEKLHTANKSKDKQLEEKQSAHDLVKSNLDKYVSFSESISESFSESFSRLKK